MLKKLPSRKIPFAVTLIIVSIVYMMWQSIGAGHPPVTSTVVPIRHSPVPTPPSVLQKPTGLYADGTYTGSPADAYYGTVQVQALIQNGKIANVIFLQHPSDRSTSVFLYNMASPVLIQEVIVAQNANVATVSGATFTSQAFKQSLASALAQAKN